MILSLATVSNVCTTLKVLSARIVLRATLVMQRFVVVKGKITLLSCGSFCWHNLISLD